jgi:hypothetical protein
MKRSPSDLGCVEGVAGTSHLLLPNSRGIQRRTWYRGRGAHSYGRSRYPASSSTALRAIRVIHSSVG